MLEILSKIHILFSKDSPFQFGKSLIKDVLYHSDLTLDYSYLFGKSQKKSRLPPALMSID